MTLAEPIYDANEHEELDAPHWSESAARAFVRRTVEETDAAFDAESGWPLHPEDKYGHERGSYRGVYSGAAGTMWGLHRLAGRSGIALRNGYAAAIAATERAYRDDPWDTDGVVPGFFMGTTGILAARYAITRDDSLLQPLADEIRRNVGNITREVFWGSAGSALAALAIREATGTNRFDGVLREVQQEYWSSWPRDGEYPHLWLQEMYGKRQRYVGAGHGAFGNLAVFIRARDLLDAAMEREVHERIVALLETYALHDDDATNWLSMAEPRVGNRLQWCHGAPGIIMALAPYPRDDERVEKLLRRGGEAIFRAGPLKKGPTFCHGTAGNGYALLRLALRTGDVIWLERARAFAMHVIAQIDRWREHYGMPAYSLFTGEIGVALFVQGVIDGDPSVLGLETL